MIVSLGLAVTEPISALMLLSLVLRFKTAAGIHPVMRVCLAALSCALIWHGFEQLRLVADYRPPRTWSWVPLFVALNGTIWTAWLTTHFRKTRTRSRT